MTFLPSREPLPLDQDTTEANAINAGTTTETAYVNGLLAQVADTTIPAVAIEGSMYGAVGSSGCLQRPVILVSPAPLDEFSQSTPGNDPHIQKYHAPKLGASQIDNMQLPTLLRW